VAVLKNLGGTYVPPRESLRLCLQWSSWGGSRSFSKGVKLEVLADGSRPLRFGRKAPAEGLLDEVSLKLKQNVKLM